MESIVALNADLRGAVMAAAGPQFWFSALLLASVAIVSTWYTLRFLVRKRLIEDTPTSLIRSAAQGYVELQGYAKLIAGDPICAPLSGLACAWYRYAVERKERSTNTRGQTDSRWRTVDRGQSDALFYLDDGTGRCVIDPDGATVTPSVRRQWYGVTATPPRITEARAWLGWSSLVTLGSQYRYTEERIAIGAPLYALGMFQTRGGAAPANDVTRETADLLSEWKADPKSLVRRFDTNSDGEIDLAEWERARAAAEQEVSANRRERPMAPAVDTLSATAHRDQPYVLAARREDQLVSRYRSYLLALGLIAFSGATAVGWAVLLRLTGSPS